MNSGDVSRLRADSVVASALAGRENSVGGASDRNRGSNVPGVQLPGHSVLYLPAAWALGGYPPS